MGQKAIKSGWLYCWAFWSRKTRNSSVLSSIVHLRVADCDRQAQRVLCCGLPIRWFGQSCRAVTKTTYAAGSAVLLSRFPLGSSANKSLGLLINALATATRCCSPPESMAGL